MFPAPFFVNVSPRVNLTNTTNPKDPFPYPRLIKEESINYIFFIFPPALSQFDNPKLVDEHSSRA